MKMNPASYQYILDQFTTHQSDIAAYAPILKATGKYKDFSTRLAFDCMRAYIPRAFIMDQLYNTEDLNDTHIKTGLVKALRTLKLL